MRAGALFATTTPSRVIGAAAAPLSPPLAAAGRPVVVGRSTAVLCRAAANENHNPNPNPNNDDDDPGYSFHSGPGYDEETRSYGILRARIALLRAREVEEARAAERAAAREAAARAAERAAAASRPPLPQSSAEAAQTWDEVMGDADLLARWHENAWSSVRDAHYPPSPPQPRAAAAGGSGGAFGGAGPAAASGGGGGSVTSSFDFGDEGFY